MSMVNFPRHWKMARFGEVATFTKKPRGLQSIMKYSDGLIQ